MKKSIIVFLAVLTILSLVLPLALANASQVQTTQVPALNSETLTINLSSGDKFTGSISISGGSGNDIDFSVTDPQGTTILDLGRVSQGRSFEFTAQQSGAYTFHLDNSFSILSSKTVSLSYDITPSILNFGSGGNSLLLIIVVIVIVILVVVIAVAASKRNSKPKAYPHQ